MKRPAFRRGFTLLELTVVMVLLVLLMSIIATTVWSTVRLERTDSAAFQRTIRHSALADQFRADVAKATEAPAKVADYVSGKQCLILVRPDGTQVIYLAKEERLERVERKGEAVQKQSIPVEHDWKVEFSLPQKDTPLVVLRFFDMRRYTAIKHPVEFGASLGGDVK